MKGHPIEPNLFGGLDQYFTDFETIRNQFSGQLIAPELDKNIIIIHGIGGIGKSSLLWMFALDCYKTQTPWGLVSGDEAKSPIDIISIWVSNLEQCGVKLPKVNKTINAYRTVQAKVDGQVDRIYGRRGKSAELLKKATDKTAEVVSGAMAGAAVGSVIPGIGTSLGTIAGGILGSIGSEFLTDWLTQFLSKPQIELLLDPAKKLTEDFLHDISHAAQKRRLVLSIDTYEKISALEQWLVDLLKRLPCNVLIVVAGRAMPKWSVYWPSWLSVSDVHELQPMTAEIMRDLILRYSTTQLGSLPSTKQVDAIIQFSRGLPVVVATSVQLWIEYGVEDFDTVKPQVLSDLVDRLLEGVSSEMRSALEAAAILRYFNSDSLSNLLELNEIEEIYANLRRFPFIRPRVEGLALHDVVRELINDNLRFHRPSQFQLLNNRAANYFKFQIQQSSRSVITDEFREWLYHLVQLSEDEGIAKVFGIAENCAQFGWIDQLRILLNDVNSFPLDKTANKIWLRYYNSRLAHLTAKLSEAEEAYMDISEHPETTPKLRAYALCDLSQLLTQNERLSQPNGVTRAIDSLRKCRDAYPKIDSKLLSTFLYWRYVFMHQGQLSKAVDSLVQQKKYYTSIKDYRGVVKSLDSVKDLYGLLGDWQLVEESIKEALQLLNEVVKDPFLRARIVGHNLWYLIWSGRYSEAERGIRHALSFAQRNDLVDSLPELHRDLGFVLGLQLQWQLSDKHFEKAVQYYKKRGEWIAGLWGTLGFWGLIQIKKGAFNKAEKLLIKSLKGKKKLQDNNGIPETLVWLAYSCELYSYSILPQEKREEYQSKAIIYYSEVLDFGWTQRNYFECAALVGLVRVNCISGSIPDVDEVFGKAKILAEKFGYLDLLSSLNLCLGYLVHFRHFDERENYDSAIKYYKRALSYALLFNRFLLDETVGITSDLPNPFSLKSVFEQDIERGVFLLEGIRSWWVSTESQLELQNEGTIIASCLQSISLIEAERVIRERDKIDGEDQILVLDYINSLLGDV